MPDTGNLTHDLRNSPMPEKKTGDQVADERLKSFVDRTVRLMQERKDTARDFNNDIKEVLSEAKGTGFDVKLIRKVATEKLRRDNMDKDDLDEEEALLRIYFRAAGVLLPPQYGDDEE